MLQFVYVRGSQSSVDGDEPRSENGDQAQLIPSDPPSLRGRNCHSLPAGGAHNGAAGWHIPPNGAPPPAAAAGVLDASALKSLLSTLQQGIEQRLEARMGGMVANVEGRFKTLDARLDEIGQFLGIEQGKNAGDDDEDRKRLKAIFVYM